jgi:hypothetical protein
MIAKLFFESSNFPSLETTYPSKENKKHALFWIQTNTELLAFVKTQLKFNKVFLTSLNTLKSSRNTSRYSQNAIFTTRW